MNIQIAIVIFTLGGVTGWGLGLLYAYNKKDSPMLKEMKDRTRRMEADLEADIQRVAKQFGMPVDEFKKWAKINY